MHANGVLLPEIVWYGNMPPRGTSLKRQRRTMFRALSKGEILDGELTADTLYIPTSKVNQFSEPPGGEERHKRTTIDVDHLNLDMVENRRTYGESVKGNKKERGFHKDSTHDRFVSASHEELLRFERYKMNDKVERRRFVRQGLKTMRIGQSRYSWSILYCRYS